MKVVLPIITLLFWMLGTLPAADSTSAQSRRTNESQEKPELTRAQAGKITEAVGKILEQGHYRQAPLDNAIAQMFLKNYLDVLDYNHLVFLQSDVDALNQKYGRSLDDLTVRGDASPAFEIFDRYLARLREREALVQALVKKEFDFTQDEKVLLARDKAPWPKDEIEAEDLWRKRIKFELLQDRLIHLGDSKGDKKSAGEVTKSEGTQNSVYKTEDTIKLISKRYSRLLKTMSEFDSEEILQIYLTALAHAYDPHSDYMSPTEAANFEINSVKLSLSGIGALLRSEDGYAKIQSLVPGGPADLSKLLKPNDRIVAVAQGNEEPVDAVDMKLSKVVDMIRGKRGTEVRLTILPAKSPDGSVKKVISLIRDEIKLTEQYAKAKIFDHVGADGRTNRLGAISLPQFYENCARDVEKLIERLRKEKVTGLVLDLRRDGGGLLDEAIKVTGLFVRQNPVVQVRDNRRTTVLRDDDPKVAYEGPLVVMVDRLSASASEIVAAALQDYGRAVIVGDQSTHGKGTVQTLLPLSQMLRAGSLDDPGKLKFTVSKFYRVAGGTTQKNGVTPDIILPSLYDYLDLGENNLPNALPADSIRPVDYRRWTQVQSVLPELKRNSENRIKASQDFAYVNEDIERLKKQRADKNISLNENQRIREKEEQTAKMEARKNERSKRKSSLDGVFEVSLDMVDKGKPIVPLAAVKANEHDQLAELTKESTDTDEEAESESDTAVDAELAESIHILHDYSILLGKLGGRRNGGELVLTD